LKSRWNTRRTPVTAPVAGSKLETSLWYQSSAKVQRGFCSVCGSTLFWKPTIPGYQWTSVALGCLDTQIQQKVAKHIFVAEKGCYYEINDGAPQSEAF
jgi:hypothetical protein